ncbi:hypothetical protein [Streptomyces gobiensis]|uniref:hypothetical protein n=1 Tax=Streptomyces gobiensis TaxID=2875706 RepID=UPI001E508BA7|nr:hypothetical protein [Streptomyces gobiensis]UGY92535.1 hypothetical protein test1122_12935 [Streptomyces gobiensis]
MAQAVRQRSLLSHVTSVLNSDGKAHPVENTFVAATVLLGAVAFVTSFFPGLHLIASWAGLAGIVTGMWGQMISATTGERFLLIIGLGASAVGLYLGMAHGGLFGGVIG